MSKKDKKKDKKQDKSASTHEAIVAKLQRLAKKSSGTVILPYVKYNSRTTDFSLRISADKSKKLIAVSNPKSKKDEAKQAKKATRFIIDFFSLELGASGYLPSKKDPEKSLFTFKSLPDEYEANEINNFIETLPAIKDAKGKRVKTAYGKAKWNPTAVCKAIAIVDGEEIYCSFTLANARQYYSGKKLIDNILKNAEDNSLSDDLFAGKISPIVYASVEEVGDYYGLDFEVEDYQKIDFKKVEAKAIEEMEKRMADAKKEDGKKSKKEKKEKK